MSISSTTLPAVIAESCSTDSATVGHVTTIGVRELRQNASKYLAQVEAGEEIDVTNHGRLVARIVPVSESARTRQALIAAGRLIPAKNPGGLLTLPPPLPAPSGTPSNAEILDELREERL